MPIKYCCHFCGRSDSLHNLEQLNVWLCSKCWEIIALVASKWYTAGARLLTADYAEAEKKVYADLLNDRDDSEK